jgi:hypothetical protein
VVEVDVGVEVDVDVDVEVEVDVDVEVGVEVEVVVVVGVVVEVVVGVVVGVVVVVEVGVVVEVEVEVGVEVEVEVELNGGLLMTLRIPPNWPPPDADVLWLLLRMRLFRLATCVDNFAGRLQGAYVELAPLANYPEVLAELAAVPQWRVRFALLREAVNELEGLLLPAPVVEGGPCDDRR